MMAIRAGTVYLLSCSLLEAKGFHLLALVGATDWQPIRPSARSAATVAGKVLVMVE